MNFDPENIELDSLVIGCPLCDRERGRVYVYTHTGNTADPVRKHNLSNTCSCQGRLHVFPAFSHANSKLEFISTLSLISLPPHTHTHSPPTLLHSSHTHPSTPHTLLYSSHTHTPFTPHTLLHSSHTHTPFTPHTPPLT